MKRASTLINFHSLLIIFHTLFYTHIRYGIGSWYSGKKNALSPINTSFDKAIKLLITILGNINLKLPNNPRNDVMNPSQLSTFVLSILLYKKENKILPN